jgi:hypothetical protein
MSLIKQIGLISTDLVASDLCGRSHRGFGRKDQYKSVLS